MEKDKINRVLNNEASEQDAREVAQWFGSVEGQLEASLMLDADMEAMVPHYDAPVRCERSAPTCPHTEEKAVYLRW